jgi:hypothetical protein
LSTMFRLRAPDSFFGSIASSPGLTSLVPYPNNTLKFAYHEWVNILVVLREFPSLLIICLATQLNNVWYDVSDAATNKIKQAMVTFKDCSQMGDCSSVPGFNFCGPQPNATSLASLYDDLILHFNFITQYNSGIKGIYPAKVLQLVTNLTLAATSDGAVARIPFDVASGSYAPNQTTQCLDWQNPNMTSSVLGEASAAWSVIQ